MDTWPDWNGAENFIRSIDEASAVGYRHIETFWNYVERWEQNPQGLKDELDKGKLRLETVSNGGRMRVNFIDPRERAGTIDDHMKLMRFIRWFGCDHVKINCGSRPKDIDQRRAEYCREMAVGFNELGKRVTDMGMKYHARTGRTLPIHSSNPGRIGTDRAPRSICPSTGSTRSTARSQRGRTPTPCACSRNWTSHVAR